MNRFVLGIRILQFLSLVLLGIAFMALNANQSAASSGGLNWHYEGPNGPNAWGSLSDSYASCATGKHQSPINITGGSSGAHPILQTFYRPTRLVIGNNDRTIWIDYQNKSAIRIGDHRYLLKSIDLHTPSEHQLNGKSFPIEIQFLHQNKDGEIAMIAVFGQTTEKENELISHFWRHLPRVATPTRMYRNIYIHAESLLPENRHFFRYQGSLTNPPCSEKVIWHVMKEPIGFSQNQIRKLQNIFRKNNRPLQPLNGRAIVSSR